MAGYDAVVFDLLSAVIDSWSLWKAVAGSEVRGLEWRKALLKRVYSTGAYQPYDQVVAGAARDVGLPEAYASEVVRRWDELQPWPEATEVLSALARRLPLATVTNCSEALGRRAVARVGVPFAVVATAERAGFYKPDPRIYGLALADLHLTPDRVLFVAGSAGDVPGAARVGMKVFWHDRIGLELPKGAAPAAVRASSLRPLLREVLG
jgi:2-haloalkanoic acid dehalogenase type II